MEIIGFGKDGVVVYPPIICDVSINPKNFVGKIYYKGKNPILVKEKIDMLPDIYDEVLYYKENYLCSIPLVIPNPRLSTEQLILRRVEGETLENVLNKLLYANV